MTKDPLVDLLKSAIDVAMQPDLARALAPRKEHTQHLEKMLDAPQRKQQFTHLFTFLESVPIRPIPPKLLRRVEQFVRASWDAGGDLQERMDEWLMKCIAFSSDPASLSLFQDAIAYTRTRGRVALARKRLAVAGIAFLAFATREKSVGLALAGLLLHGDMKVRVWAVDGISAVGRTSDGTLNAATHTLLEEIARNDKSFEPRFVARNWLRNDGHMQPVEPPRGVFAFKVSLGKASRTIEFASGDTLNVWVGAVLGTFGWDEDHLFEFRFSDALDHRNFRVASHEDAWSSGKNRENGFATMPIGALGLRKGDSFEWIYDFGDMNRFSVKVIEVREKAAPRARYPRVVKREGMSPAQYPRSEW